MTDEALAGGVDAPAETTGAPIEQDQTRVPDPLGPQTPTAEKPDAKAEPEPKDAKPEKPKTAGEAIKRAQEQLKAKEAEKAKADDKAKAEQKEKVEAKPEPKAEKERDETGKFKSSPEKAVEQEAQRQAEQRNSPHRDAPARFDEAAKAEWEKAPDSVKGATHRVLREMEQGIQKYKGDAERYELVREYDDLARKNGYQGVHESLKRVGEIEDAFQRSPIEGFQKIADHFGISLRAVAAHIMGQKPEQVEAQRDSTVSALKQEIAGLKQQISNVTPVIEQIRTESNARALQDWAADKPHFSRLRAEVTEYVKQGVAPDEAYTRAVEDFQEKARAFGFSPVGQAEKPSAAHTGTHDEPAHTRTKPANPNGQKSIAGAPTSGTKPTGKKPTAPSASEAIKRAMAQHRV